MTRVVIADSNHIIRCGLATIFGNYEEIELVGEAVNDASLEELVTNFEPDVVMMDFVAPGFSIDSVPKVKQLCKGLKVVAITTEQSSQTVVNALRVGVDSYIKKDCDINEIVDSVKETGKGGKFFCGQILEAVRRDAIDLHDVELGELNCEPVSLSRREMEVITMIAEGHTNNQIAEKLFLSAHTVNTHRKNIMQKLGVNNTAAIVMYAVKAQLVSPNKFLFSPQGNE
ncbi:MAG: response regulator transcription factor [Flavobacteriales bacterium]|nr:response regulator transcription factor [Flavobacteriales bacterium]